MQAKILPRSVVGVAKILTPFPAIVKIPTVFSGFDYQFHPKNKIFFLVKRKIKIK